LPVEEELQTIVDPWRETKLIEVLRHLDLQHHLLSHGSRLLSFLAGE